jgi:hypothetical protein
MGDADSTIKNATVERDERLSSLKSLPRGKLPGFRKPVFFNLEVHQS